MTCIATLNPPKALRLSLAAFAVATMAACQTVDLGNSSDSTKKAAASPACAVSAGDYKVLAYLQKGGDDNKTKRISAVLKKKYAALNTGSEANPIMAAQTFVADNPDKSPAELEALVESACKK